jgi:hypothetical protein
MAVVECRVLHQDRSLQLAQRHTRLDPDFADERLARPPVGIQSVCLSARSIQREHELGPESLPQWMVLDQPFQLRDGVRVATELEVGVDPLLERREPCLLQTCDLVLGERLGRELDERGPPPAGERLAQLRRSLVRLGTARLLDEPLEALEVEASGLHVDDITGWPPLEDTVAEQSPKGVHLVLKRRARGARRVRPPQLVDQLVLCHGLVGAQQ